MTLWRSISAEQTRAAGRELAAALGADDVLLLSGGLGAGKTVLVQGLAAGLGIDPAEIQSPTFTLVREHRHGAARLFHLDLYRLEPDEVDAAGVLEILAGPGVKAVEWPERLPMAPPGAWQVAIERRGEERIIRQIAPAAESPPADSTTQETGE